MKSSANLTLHEIRKYTRMIKACRSHADLAPSFLPLVRPAYVQMAKALESKLNRP